MATGKRSALLTTQLKKIDGLPIRFARSDKKDGDSILPLSPFPEGILAFLPTWDSFADLLVGVCGAAISLIQRRVVLPKEREAALNSTLAHTS
jgi:hypothetical protein